MWDQLRTFLKGKKSNAVGFAIIGYVLGSWVSGTPIDPEVIYTLLGAGVLTLRAAVNGGKAGSGTPTPTP